MYQLAHENIKRTIYPATGILPSENSSIITPHGVSRKIMTKDTKNISQFYREFDSDKFEIGEAGKTYLDIQKDRNSKDE